MHTPGPWTWTDGFGRREGSGRRLCNLYGETFEYSVVDPDGFAIAHCNGPLVTMERERSEANARLMAAAPDLLDACQVMLGLIEADKSNGLDNPYEEGILRAAISKATGTEVAQ